MESSQFSKRGAKARGLDAGSDATPEVDEAHRDCWVCRSTGVLTSNADGEPHEVVCPWCEGTKRTIPAHDAQEKPSETPREKTPEEIEAAKERAKAMLAKRGAAKKTADGTAKAPAKRKPAAKKAGAKKAPAKRAASKKAAPPANTPIPRPLTRKTVRDDG